MGVNSATAVNNGWFPYFLKTEPGTLAQEDKCLILGNLQLQSHCKWDKYYSFGMEIIHEKGQALSEGQGKKTEAANPGREGASIPTGQSGVTHSHTRKLAHSPMGHERPGQERDQANTLSSWPFCQPQRGTAAPFTNDQREAQAGPRFACSPPRGGGSARAHTQSSRCRPAVAPQCCAVSRMARVPGPARPAVAVLTVCVGSALGGSDLILKRKSKD